MEKKDYLTGLNESQLKAVKATEGRVRCCAGAGTGKTKTLVARFCYLISEKGVNPNDMLCITFTNNAADEMRNRVKTALGVNVSKENISTIHSLCYRIVRIEGELIGWTIKDGFGNPILNVLDDDGVKELAETVIEKLNLKERGTKVIDVMRAVNDYKSKEDYVGKNMTTGKFNKNDMAQAFLFEQFKYKVLTFDDLLYFAHYLLRTYPDVIDRWQRFKYIQIDEVQDCSGVDWEIVNMLAKKYGNLFFVGDWNQSIYGFRGSNPSYMLEAPYDESYMLEKNYRSFQPILDLSNKSIESNKILENVVLEANRGKGEGVLPIVKSFRNTFEEADWIGEKVKGLINNGVSPNDIAILYRVNRFSAPIERAMNGNGIPYKMLGSLRFYDRREISLILCVLKVLLNNDLIAFSKLSVALIKGFGRQGASEVIDKSVENNEKVMKTFAKLSEQRGKFNKEPIHNFITSMATLVRKLKDGISLSDFFVETVNTMKMDDYWKNNEVDETVYNERMNNIAGLFSVAKMFERGYDTDDKKIFPDFLETTQLRDEEGDETKETVKLMSVHKSKGMEFPYVFVAVLTDGVFPSSMSIKEDPIKGVEEERRLFYVACTRAKDMLFLTSADYPYANGKFPMDRSRFIDEVEGCFKEDKKVTQTDNYSKKRW